MRLFVLSSISGLFSSLSIWLPHALADRYTISDDLLFFLPGVLFFLLIVFPVARKKKSGMLRTFGLLLSSIVAWYGAVSIGFLLLPLVKQAAVLACALSGSVGVTILSIACRYFLKFRFRASEIILALVCGLVGGAIIGMGVQQPRASLSGDIFYFFGFLFWHCSVAMSLFRLHYNGRKP